MAIAPLFVADMATLKAKLRLSGVSKTDALAIIDGAVEDVRLLLYDSTQGLGSTLVAEILAIAYVENATTAEALRRTRANSLESKWVRLLLLRRLPSLFMDAGAVTRDVFNDEPFTRSSGRKLLDEIKALEDAIANDLGVLLGEEDSVGLVDAITFEPDDTPDRPWDSISPLRLDT